MERRRKLFVSNLVSVALALACFLLILAISNDFQKTWDVTDDQRHSFSKQTIDFMKEMEQPVKLYAFVDPRGDSSLIDKILERYERLAPRYFSYEIVDLQKNPTMAERFQVRSYGVGVLELEEEVPEGETPRRERIFSFDEASITNGLTKLLREGTKSVYFLVGHGERRPDEKGLREVTALSNSLRTEGYQAKPLSLAETGSVPDDAEVLVMAGPSGELLANEKNILEEYLRDQGKLLFMVDLNTPASYQAWLAEYGMVIEDSVIIDTESASVNAEPVTPIGQQYSPDHPITRDFRSITEFTLARPLEIGEVSVEGLEGNLTTLAATGPRAFTMPLAELLKGEAVTFSSEGKEPGSYKLALAGRYTEVGATAPTPSPTPGEAPQPQTPTSRIVVTSSTDSFDDDHLGKAGNRDFVLNAVNWLAQSENQITVRVKDPKIQPVTVPKQTQNWLYFIFCILIPVLSALTGLLIAYFRSKGKKL